MSQRVDQRAETKIELLCYDKALKLSDFTLSVCKPKDKNVNTKHIAKRQKVIGDLLIQSVVELGADILEANQVYVGDNLPAEDLLRHLEQRIALQENAKRQTFRMEHMMRTLHFDRPFADSTITYWTELLVETRDSISKWRASDVRRRTGIVKKVGS